MNTSLPIYPFKDAIISAVRENETTILTAETGSGKSTQVPQYLHEAGFRVVCTEPRRIACVTLAERVAKEMERGELVGYQTAFESTKTPSTEILFCTDGLRLAQGIHDTETVLIVDELHEWNLNVETLVAWVKKHREAGGHIRVVLMSATLDAISLMKYFEGKARHLEIPGRTFAVEKHYELGEDKEYLARISYLVNVKGKNVLAFRPGKREIAETIRELERMNLSAEILPMHGDLPLVEQEKCFKSYRRPKVIVATNIAQTSLTIPDITAVVDDGMEKRVEIMSGIESLLPLPISRADSEQRAGRAGRVREGEYYLISTERFEDRDEYAVPEIQRLLLDRVVLKLASVGIDAAKVRFFHQPCEDSIREAKDLLLLLSAIDEKGITPLGRRLIEYPLSVRHSMVVEKAKEFGIVKDILKAVAVLESNGSLVDFRKEKPENGTLKSLFNYGYRDFTKEERSDILAEMDIFDNFRDVPFRDLDPGINRKSFIRFRDLYTKLLEHVETDEERVTPGDYYEKFLKCLYAGYPDRIFRDVWGGYSNGRDEYKFSRNSCARQTNLVLAIPRNVFYKDKYDNSDRMLAVIEKISSIPQELVGNILDKDKIREEVTVDYSSWNGERFLATAEYLYMGALRLGCIEIEIRDGDPHFEDAMKELASYDEEIREAFRRRQEILEEEKRKREEWERKHPEEIKAEIGGKTCILHRTYGGRYYCEFALIEEIPDADKWPDPDGNDVAFRYKDLGSTSPRHLKAQAMQRYVSALNVGRRKRKQVAVEDVNVFLEKFWKYLGEFTEYDDDANPTVKWFGLSYDRAKESVRTVFFDSKEAYEEETIKGFRRLFEKWVHAELPTSAFTFEKRGQKVTNSSTEECKELFRAYAKDIVNAVTFENFAESKEEARAIYRECLSMMEENPW